MNEEKIRKMVSDSFFENIMNNLDSSIIFKYIEGLEKENRELDKENNKLVAKLNKNKILQNEFKEWLEIYIEDRDKTRKLHKEYSLSEEKLSSQYFILQQVLSKYKEIIGDK